MAAFYFPFSAAGPKPPVRRIQRGPGGLIKTPGKEFQEKTAKHQMTANQIAAFNLTRELDKYIGEINKDKRVALENAVAGLDQIRTMNMKYLAAALFLLGDVILTYSTRDVPNDVYKRAFAGDAWEQVKAKLMTKQESPETILKYQEELFIYMYRVVNFRKERFANVSSDDAVVSAEEYSAAAAAAVPISRDDEDD